MALLIDSSILVEHERGRLNLPAWLRARGGDRVAISTITLIELYHGVYRATDLSIQARRREYVELCRRDFVVVPVDEGLAETAGRVRAELQARGTLIGSHDLLIGVTALVLGFDLATANAREFTRIPGLNVFQWHGTPPATL